MKLVLVWGLIIAGASAILSGPEFMLLRDPPRTVVVASSRTAIGPLIVERSPSEIIAKRSVPIAMIGVLMIFAGVHFRQSHLARRYTL